LNGSKVLNIFLRDCFYTEGLRAVFNLDKAEDLFELPLDSITADSLHKKHRGEPLQRWTGVINVDPQLNDKYQKAALAYALRRGIARVHLDALW
jgi:hypothetical protein